MKRCPICNTTYSDEQAFCTNDGTTLVSSETRSDSPGNPYSASPGGATPPPTQAYGAGTQPGYQPPSPPGMFPPPPPPGGPTFGASGPVSKLQPALIGGGAMGALAIITAMVPVPLVSWCCCLWGVLGGVLAVYIYVKRSPTPVRMGDGAMLGLLAGAIGGLIYALIAFPVTYFAIDPELVQSQIQDRLRRSGSQFDIRPYWVWFLMLSVFLGGLILTALSLIGGLIGVPIFEKRQSNVAPPPPPQYQ
jgi:hypothetical protein